MPTYRRHAAENRLEIAFERAPRTAVREALRSAGFRWNPRTVSWFAEETPARLTLVERICGGAELETAGVAPPAAGAEGNRRCCYAGTVGDFLAESLAHWMETMRSSFFSMCTLQLDELQERAWEDCFATLQRYLPQAREDCQRFGILFEYALPYESGRRPDVLLVSQEQVLVLEFKMKDRPLPDDIDQVAAYARDLREYHCESRGRTVTPVLVLTRTAGQGPVPLQRGVVLISVDRLPQLLEQEMAAQVTPCDLEGWMCSQYEPLPSIVEAARMFMAHQPLPNIRRVNSTGIPQAIQHLTALAEEAERHERHILALVTGVPGAGKTFLGLKFVYDVCQSNEHANSIYLSGNGALIKVLTDALGGNRAFVRNIHAVILEHSADEPGEFHKNILVFDEGQRAWDRQQMRRRRNIDRSEPDVLVNLADRSLDWAVLLILVGEGQEIYTGENAGLVQWNTALERAQGDWEVVCPEGLTDIFQNNPRVVNLTRDDNLNLNTTLRSYLASDVSQFVNLLMGGQIAQARALANSILDAGFNMYVTRDLERAKAYCRGRYEGNENKRYGLVASSRAYNLRAYGMASAWAYTPRGRQRSSAQRDSLDVAAWFNRAPSEAGSCCQLRAVASEFDCQGLEVDMPIVGWGDDLLWAGTGWARYVDPRAANQDDANAYRVNSYRVLLTRGRDGFIVFVPDERRYDATYAVLLEAGVEVLDRQG